MFNGDCRSLFGNQQMVPPPPHVLMTPMDFGAPPPVPPPLMGLPFQPQRLPPLHHGMMYNNGPCQPPMMTPQNHGPPFINQVNYPQIWDPIMNFEVRPPNRGIMVRPPQPQPVTQYINNNNAAFNPGFNPPMMAQQGKTPANLSNTARAGSTRQEGNLMVIAPQNEQSKTNPSTAHLQSQLDRPQLSKTQLIKPEPIRPKSGKRRPIVHQVPQNRPEQCAYLDLFEERQEAYRQVKQILIDAEVPLKVTNPDVLELFMSLPENLKEAINHQGGYKVFLQQCAELEVKDGWIELAQTDSEEDKVDCDHFKSDVKVNLGQTAPSDPSPSEKSSHISPAKQSDSEKSSHISPTKQSDSPVVVSSPTVSPVGVVSPLPAADFLPNRSAEPETSPVPFGSPLGSQAQSPVGSLIGVTNPISNQVLVSSHKIVYQMSVSSPVPVGSPEPVISPLSSPVSNMSPIPDGILVPVPIGSPEPVPYPVQVGSPVFITRSGSVGSGRSDGSPGPVGSPELHGSPKPIGNLARPLAITSTPFVPRPTSIANVTFENRHQISVAQHNQYGPNQQLNFESGPDLNQFRNNVQLGTTAGSNQHPFWPGSSAVMQPSQSGPNHMSHYSVPSYDYSRRPVGYPFVSMHPETTSDDVDDSFLESQYLPEPKITIDEKIMVYRLLKGVILIQKTIDFTDQAFLNIIINLNEHVRNWIKSVGGFLTFLKDRAAMQLDKDLLDILISHEKGQGMLEEASNARMLDDSGIECKDKDFNTQGNSGSSMRRSSSDNGTTVRVATENGKGTNTGVVRDATTGVGCKDKDFRQESSVSSMRRGSCESRTTTCIRVATENGKGISTSVVRDATTGVGCKHKDYSQGSNSSSIRGSSDNRTTIRVASQNGKGTNIGVVRDTSKTVQCKDKDLSQGSNVSFTRKGSSDIRTTVRVAAENCKETNTDVVTDASIGINTDTIEMASSFVDAVTATKDCSVDTDDLTLSFVDKHRQLTKKLALLQDRAAHERMRSETLKEKNDAETKTLKDKYNKGCAELKVLSKELKNATDNGGLSLQLQLSQAQSKNYKDRLTAVQVAQESLIQELGKKTKELLFLEAQIKSEAQRKANIVKVNQSSSTVQDDSWKERQLELSSQDRALQERLRAAEVQIWKMEHNKRMQEVKKLLDEGEYTYNIFAMDLEISAHEKELLKAQWDKYYNQANEHLQSLDAMVQQKLLLIESSGTLDNIPDVKMPDFKPFTVLCQVSATSPSDLHFIVAPPMGTPECQSPSPSQNVSLDSQAPKGLPLKVATHQTTRSSSSVSPAVNVRPYGSDMRKESQGKVLPDPRHDDGVVIKGIASLKRMQGLLSKKAFTRASLDAKLYETNIDQLHDGRKLPTVKQIANRHTRMPTTMSKALLPHGVKQQNPSNKVPVKPAIVQDPETADLESLLASCFELASSFPSKEDKLGAAGKLPKVSAKLEKASVLVPSSSSHQTTKGDISSGVLPSSKHDISENSLQWVSPMSSDVNERVDNQMVPNQASSSLMAVPETEANHDNHNKNSHTTAENEMFHITLNHPKNQRTSKIEPHNKSFSVPNQTRLGTSQDNTRVAMPQAVSGEKAKVDNVAHQTDQLTDSLKLGDTKLYPTIDDTQCDMVTSINSADDITPEKEATPDAPVLSSSDTGIVDGSASSEANDLSSTAYNTCTSSEYTSGEIVLEDNSSPSTSDDDVNTKNVNQYSEKKHNHSHTNGPMSLDFEESSSRYDWNKVLMQSHPSCTTTDGQAVQEEEVTSNGQRNDACSEAKATEKNKEDLCSLFLPAFATKDVNSASSNIHDSAEIEEDNSKEVPATDVFLPAWMKPSKQFCL